MHHVCFYQRKRSEEISVLSVKNNPFKIFACEYSS